MFLNVLGCKLGFKSGFKSLKLGFKLGLEGDREFSKALIVGALALAGCTAGGGSTAGGVSGALIPKSSKLTSPKSVAGNSETMVCETEDLAVFEKPEGELIDPDRESLPRGLFLASQAEFAIEKKSEAQDGGGISRVVVREVIPAKRPEVVCAEGVAKFGDDFEISLSGLVKFQTNEKPEGSAFTSRQFFFFQDKDGYGIVVSNPKPLISQSPMDIRQILRSSPLAPQLFRVNDRTYILKYSKERDGVRAHLSVHLELF